MRRRLRTTPRFYLLLTGLLLLGFAVSCGLNCLRSSRLDRRITELAARRQAQAQQLESLAEALAFAQTDAFVERVARSRLNLLYPGEIRYIAAPEPGAA